MTNFFFKLQSLWKKDYKGATFMITFSLSACMKKYKWLNNCMINKDRNYFFLIKVWLEALKSRPTELSIFWEPHSMTLYLVTSINGRYNRYHRRKILFVYVPQDMSLAFIVKTFLLSRKGENIWHLIDFI